MPVLLVTSPGSPLCEGIQQCLASLGLPMLTALSCHAARDLLYRTQGPLVVLTAVTLSDGNWCDLLTFVVRSTPKAGVILYSEAADERLWSEAIWRGAFDVLTTPFDPSHVRNCIESAMRALTGGSASAAAAF